MTIKLVASDGKQIGERVDSDGESIDETSSTSLIVPKPPVLFSLKEKIKSYLTYIAGNKYLNYDPLAVDIYRVVGADEGPNASPPRAEIGLYNGRFIDVIARAVEKPNFYPNQTMVIPHTFKCGQIYRETVINLGRNEDLTDLLK